MSVVLPKSLPRNAVSVVLLSLLGLGLSGCGSDSDTNSGSASTTVTGTVFAAAVDGASCVVNDANGDTIAGPVTSSADGSYSVNVPDANLADNLMLVCNGGTFTDEATGATGQAAGTLAAYVAGGTLGVGSSVHATPDSTIIHDLVTSYGSSLANAQATFNSAFGYTPDHSIAPTDATSPASGADEGALLAGLRAAAFSQMAKDMGLAAGQQFELLSALAKDLSDGALDGVDASGQVNIGGDSLAPLSADIQNQFGTAMLNFRAGNDATGLANDKIGSLPFATTALSTSYKVEYVPGMMAAMQGKSQFKVRITDLVTEQPVSGAAVTLMPMMYMAAHNHSTPVDGACTESSTAGTYDCTTYYLMASSMMDGMSMGYWDLKVMIGGMTGESVNFYPSVMMAMGDTARADLKGVEDKAMNMMGMMENRRYNLFKSSLSGMTGNHSFQLFIAAGESMMSFPALTDGVVLNTGETYELTAGTIVVEVSTDQSTWVTATADGSGYWTAAGLAGLTDGTEGSVYVKLSVSGEQKTTNGQAADGTNDFATFTVTPAMSMSDMSM